MKIYILIPIIVLYLAINLFSQPLKNIKLLDQFTFYPCSSLTLNDSLLFAASGNFLSVHKYQIENTNQITYKKINETRIDNINKLEIYKNYLIVLRNFSEFQFYDFSDISNIRLASTYKTSSLEGKFFKLFGDKLYLIRNSYKYLNDTLVQYFNNLEILNLENVTNIKTDTIISNEADGVSLDFDIKDGKLFYLNDNKSVALKIHKNLMYRLFWDSTSDIFKLAIYDISKGSPVFQSLVDSLSNANSIEADSDFVFITGTDFTVIDVSIPSSPKLVRKEYTKSLDIKVFNNLVFLADSRTGIKTYNPYDLKNFSVGIANTTKDFLDFAIKDNYVFVPSKRTIDVYDVSSLPKIQLVKSFDLSDKIGDKYFITKIKITGNKLALSTKNREYFWLPDNYSPDIAFWDISSPLNPKFLKEVLTDGNVMNFEIRDDYLYIDEWINGFSIFDIKDINNPFKLSSFSDKHYNMNHDFNENAFSFYDNYMLMNTGTIFRFDISDKSNPIFLDNYLNSKEIFTISPLTPTCFLTVTPDKLCVMDMSYFIKPKEISCLDINYDSQFTQLPSITRIIRNQAYLYDDSGIETFDISNLNDIKKTGRCTASLGYFDYGYVESKLQQFYCNNNYIILAQKGYMAVLKNDDFTNVDKNIENTNNLTLTPNPASDFLEISVGAQLAVPLQNIDIFSVLGIRVLSATTNLTPALSEGEGVRIDVSSLPQGIYFVKVGAQVGKFLKL